MELMEAPPTPTSITRAKVRFMTGKVIARPEIARGPTPCPMKMLSMMLYREKTTIAAMAGMEYRRSSFPMGSVLNKRVARVSLMWTCLV